MARYPRHYNTLHPSRYQVRESVRGGFYVLDTNPDTFSCSADFRHYFEDTTAIVPRDNRGNYLYRTYDGARNHATRLNARIGA